MENFQFATTWVCEFIFSSVNSMISKYTASISVKNLASEWRCDVSVQDFEALVWHKNVKHPVRSCHVNYVLKW